MRELTKGVQEFEAVGRGEHHLTPLLLLLAKHIEINEAEIESLKSRMATCQAFIESRDVNP